MPDKRQERFSPPAVGGISLLVVFAVLCLTVFALLALTTAQANVRLADASARAVEEYYAADCKAQEILARLRGGERPEGVQISGVIASYAVPLSDTQELQVDVALDSLLSDAAADGCTVLRWQVVSTEEWESDSSIEIWDGTLF